MDHSTPRQQQGAHASSTISPHGAGGGAAAAPLRRSRRIDDSFHGKRVFNNKSGYGVIVAGKSMLRILWQGGEHQYCAASEVQDWLAPLPAGALSLQNCSVCWNPIGTNGPASVVVGCGHAACGGCMDKWLERTTTCMQCRAAVVATVSVSGSHRVYDPKEVTELD